MMLPPVLWSSSHSPAAEMPCVIVIWTLELEAHLRLCTAPNPTWLPARSTTREARKTVWGFVRASSERRIVTKVRTARMASGIPTSRPKRWGKPVSDLRLAVRPEDRLRRPRLARGRHRVRRHVDRLYRCAGGATRLRAGRPGGEPARPLLQQRAWLRTLPAHARRVAQRLPRRTLREAVRGAGPNEGVLRYRRGTSDRP